MATYAQTEANRRNAQHSTGPRTPEGKAASSQNAFKLGLAARTFTTIGHEDQADFDHFTKRLLDQYQPSTAIEDALVMKMAQHYWNAQRALLVQDTCWENDVYALRLPDTQAHMKLMLRYQTTHDRAFHKCIAELRAIQAERRREDVHQIRIEQHPLRQRQLALKVANAESLQQRKLPKELPPDPQPMSAATAAPVSAGPESQPQAA